MNGQADLVQAHLKEAIEIASRLGARPELARAQLNLARLLRGEDREASANHARDAEDLFAQLGMDPFRRQARALMETQAF